MGHTRAWIAAVVALLAAPSALAQDSASRPRPGVAQREAKPIRVLYVEDVPRWEYRYVKNALLHTGGTVVQVWLCAADDGFQQEHTIGEEPLRRLPRTAEELGGYDVLLIGDVPRTALGATAKERVAWCRTVVEFVRGGGGVGFLAGAPPTVGSILLRAVGAARAWLWHGGRITGRSGE